jgi:hypothetical protein
MLENNAISLSSMIIYSRHDVYRVVGIVDPEMYFPSGLLHQWSCRTAVVRLSDMVVLVALSIGAMR